MKELSTVRLNPATVSSGHRKDTYPSRCHMNYKQIHTHTFISLLASRSSEYLPAFVVMPRFGVST